MIGESFHHICTVSSLLFTPFFAVANMRSPKPYQQLLNVHQNGLPSCSQLQSESSNLERPQSNVELAILVLDLILIILHDIRLVNLLHI